MVKVLMAGVLPLVVAAGASAQGCPCGSGTRVSGADLAALLAGKTVCAAVGNEQWQEFHGGGGTGGTLVDYKKGPNDPVDPSTTVGSWSVANDMVSYNYGGGGTYAYAVCQSGNTLDFCGARNITGATLRAGQTACNASQAVQLRGSRPQSPKTPVR
jgi:hypothetical protein